MGWEGSPQVDLSTGQRVSDHLFNSFWPAYVQPDWPLVGKEGQLKGEKETATSLTLDEVQHPLRPGGSPWKTEGVPIGQFLKLLNSGEEVVYLFSSRDTLICIEAANNWYIFG
jgi:hypothetical protein